MGRTVRRSLAVCLLVIIAAGCAPEETRLPLQKVELGPGGEVPTVELLETDDARQLVAPTVDGLYVRQVEEDRWRRYNANWPTGGEDRGPTVFSTVDRARAGQIAEPGDYFAVVDNRLWTVGMDGTGQPPRLLLSDDPTAGWQDAELPEESNPGRDRVNEMAALLPATRLITEDNTLFVADERRLWRAVDVHAEIENGRRSVDWEAVSLQGTPLGDAEELVGDAEELDSTRRGQFPLRLRHYLPATEDHPYELVTVHGRNLEVYRRGADQEVFEHTATLEMIGRDLVRQPGGESIYLVDAASLYRSDDGGESWEELDVARDSLEPEDYRRLEIRADDQAEAGYQLWVIGGDGGLWRSQDGGRVWDELRQRDPDARALTALVFDDERDQIWASTNGEGMLRSDTAGENWQMVNRGLEAAEPMVAALAGADQFVMGSSSGLYRRSMLGAAGDNGETQIGGRATTAVHIEPGEGRMITGTAGGGIELYVEGQKVETSEIAAIDVSDDVEFRPPHLEGVQMASSTILDVVRRPESGDLVAWSHRQGPLISNDDGESWRRHRLDDAFRDAIDGSVISHFLMMRDQTYFAVTRPRGTDRPTHVWRSGDGGATWQTTYSFREDPEQTPIQLVRLPDDQGLMMAHGSHLATSVDQGQTWSSISGPWDSGMITGLAVDGDRLVVVMELPHASEIAWVDDPIDSASVVQRHRLSWPVGHVPDSQHTLGVQVRGDRVLLQAGDTIYRGEMPRRATGGPDSVSLVVALGAMIGMVTLAFGYLRRWEA